MTAITAMKYTAPIESDDHAAFCAVEAVRRYNGQLIRDAVGILAVLGTDGITHKDAVLRALSVYPEKERGTR